MRRDFQIVTPEAADIPSIAVSAFIDRLEDKRVPMHSFLMLRGDKIAAPAAARSLRCSTGTGLVKGKAR